LTALSSFAHIATILLRPQEVNATTFKEASHAGAARFSQNCFLGQFVVPTR
jgi:hypothetical protein